MSSASGTLPGNMTFTFPVSRFPFPAELQPRRRRFRHIPYTDTDSPPSARGCCACRAARDRSEEHTSELQSQSNLVCRLLLEKKKALAALTERASLLRRLC